MTQTIIVSNRLPVSIKKGDKGLEVYPSSGGLATGMSSYANKRGNLWIGWPGITSDELSETDKNQIITKLAKYNCQPVFLTKKQLDDYYNGYSNSVLWPFLHKMEPDLSHEEKHWRAYREVNELFSEAVLATSRPGSTIWVHDYQLMLLPKLLRDERPNDNIGFFLHIPFPKAEHFANLKQAATLIRGLMGGDLIGFHTSGYSANFIDSATTLTGATPINEGLALKERAIRVADFPMGIDYVKFRDATKTSAVQKELNKLKLRYRGKKIILTVDRLDPTKGFIERLEAYWTFLAETPELHGKVIMLMLAVPSREDIEAYRQLRKDVESLVRTINNNFGTKTWKPIVYMYKSVSFERLNALYQIADVAFVAPIRDGMNLVAKEYIASQRRKKGILILSETAGAAGELKDALLVNPEKTRTLVQALKKAVKMPRDELRHRFEAMEEAISSNTVHDWASEFMTALKKPMITNRVPHLNELRITNLINNYTAASKRLIMLDYDGVLAPFRSNPADSSPSGPLLKVLEKICSNSKNSTVIISGRSQNDLDSWLSHLPITLVAEHGAVVRHPGKKWKHLSDEDDSWKALLLPTLRKRASEAPGAFVEEKAQSLVWHYRSAGAYAAQKQIAIIKASLKPYLQKYKLKLFSGSKIIEIKSPKINKGNAVKALLDKPYDFILAIGDDFTDEDMFKALPKRAFTIKVGPGKTAARYRLSSVSKVHELLQRL